MGFGTFLLFYVSLLLFFWPWLPTPPHSFEYAVVPCRTLCCGKIFCTEHLGDVRLFCNNDGLPAHSEQDLFISGYMDLKPRDDVLIAKALVHLKAAPFHSLHQREAGLTALLRLYQDTSTLPLPLSSSIITHWGAHKSTYFPKRLPKSPRQEKIPRLHHPLTVKLSHVPIIQFLRKIPRQ